MALSVLHFLLVSGAPGVAADLQAQKKLLGKLLFLMHSACIARPHARVHVCDIH